MKSFFSVLFKILAIALITFLVVRTTESGTLAQSSPRLHISYPSGRHQTQSDRIFVVGNAPPQGEVWLNRKKVKRSKLGNFAPSTPLQMGENNLAISYQANQKTEQINLKIERIANQPNIPKDLGLVLDSLYPNLNIARQAGERICFRAIATPNAEVKVKIGDRSLNLLPTFNPAQLPDNSSILVNQNQAVNADNISGFYAGCTEFKQEFNRAIKLEKPIYTVIKDQKLLSQTAKGSIEILNGLEVAEVVAESAIARTGAGSDFSRLTPLPKGTQALVTGKEGDWLRLDYGGWIEAKSVKLRRDALPPRSLVRSLSTRQIDGWTEVVIPLQVPVPISVLQSDRIFRLTLHNVTAQTDTILANADPVIQRFDWQQVSPEKVQYDILLKSSQVWGYKVRYAGTTLILSLRHPPAISPNKNKNLEGIKILLDPGHGSKADLGSRGGTGYPEKDVTLIVSKLLRTELQNLGANVILTRDGDQDILPAERASMIEKNQPNLALSLHYNALPDRGDAENTQGVGMFWYHSQSQEIAQFLHDYLVRKLSRKSYGVFWNNLALTRPTVAPSILMELGFMTHPEEFEWITDSNSQKYLAQTLAQGISTWIAQAASK